MDYSNLDEISLSKWQYLQHCTPIMLKFNLQGMTNNVKFVTFSVGDTTWHFTIAIEQDN